MKSFLVWLLSAGPVIGAGVCRRLAALRPASNLRWVANGGLSLIVLLATPLYAQQKQPVSSLQEDCGVTFAFTTASSGLQATGTTTAGSTGTTAAIDNTQAGCIDWLVTYSTTSTVATVSLLFQTANNVAGSPGTWSAYPGTLNTGINPNTAILNGAVTDATGAKYPFLRMNMTAKTGAGTVSGKLYGWKRRPEYVSIAAGSSCPGATPCVVVGNKSNNAVVPGSTNLGVLPALANAAAPTWTEGFEVLLSSDLAGNLRVTNTPSGTQTVVGNKSNNAAAPGATNIGALGCIANAAAPTWTEGFEVLCSVDLAGNQRVKAMGTLTNNNAAPAATNFGVLPCLANAAAPTWTEGNQVLCSEDLSGNLRITGAVTQTATSTALADALSNTEPLPTASAAAVNQRTFPQQFNGSTWDRQFVCPNQASVTLADATRTQIVAASGATIIRVCHIHMTTTAAENFTVSMGTGAACVTGLTTIDDYLSVQALAMDFQPTAALRTTASQALCVTQSGTQSAKVTVMYAQF